jgi:hypothetical protein
MSCEITGCARGDLNRAQSTLTVPDSVSPSASWTLFDCRCCVAASGPFMADWAGIDNFLPPDFEARLARAWAWTVWPHLMTGSKMKAFSADDPIRYWLTTWTSGSPRSPPLSKIG